MKRSEPRDLVDIGVEPAAATRQTGDDYKLALVCLAVVAEAESSSFTSLSPPSAR